MSPPSSLRFAHPSAPAWQAQLERRARTRHLWRQPWLVVGAIGSLAIVLLTVWWRLRIDGAGLLSVLSAQSWPLALLAFFIAWSSTRHAAVRARREFALSWFAATPLAKSEIGNALRNRVGRRVLPAWGIVLLLPLAAMAASGQRAWPAFALLAVAIGGGLVAGWRSAKHVTPSAGDASPRLAPTRKAASTDAGFAALARLPFARWLADAEPRQHAKLIGAMLLMLPAGMPPLAALLCLLFVASLIAMWGLLRAVLATIAQAAAWLHATPMPLASFVRALAERPTLMLAFLAGVAGLGLAGLGLPATRAAGFAVGAFAACSTAILQALAWRHRPRRAWLETFASGGAALIALATATWLLPWLLSIAWLRGLLRLRRA